MVRIKFLFWFDWNLGFYLWKNWFTLLQILQWIDVLCFKLTSLNLRNHNVSCLHLHFPTGQNFIIPTKTTVTIWFRSANFKQKKTFANDVYRAQFLNSIGNPHLNPETSGAQIIHYRSWSKNRVADPGLGARPQTALIRPFLRLWPLIRPSRDPNPSDQTDCRAIQIFCADSGATQSFVRL